MIFQPHGPAESCLTSEDMGEVANIESKETHRVNTPSWRSSQSSAPLLSG